MIEIIAEAIWLILPAYIANSSAVLIGGGKPIDFGKKWKGKPILGEGKTWRGLAGGIICGFISGIILNKIWNLFGYGFSSFLIILSLSFGALLGDIAKSFLKRRLNIARGKPLPLLDQIDFLLGAFFLAFIVDKEWFLSSFTIYHILFLLILTPILHLVTNIIAYLLGLKNVPW
ncbi:MAG: CDP-2,3-bis-(O-geranylgeranyl)-sn-glycerol synthase [Thermoplasmatales archaeon]|nr:CDP-2,3-bis-(O-geranylgeranyl)-sn-glycerol synthase [Thermoplasmatales archaeon]